jgi:chaperone BCS1
LLLFVFKVNLFKLLLKIIFEDNFNYKSKTVTITNKTPKLYRAIKWFISNNFIQSEYYFSNIIKKFNFKKKYIKLINQKFTLLFLSNNINSYQYPIQNSNLDNKIILNFTKFKNEIVINNFLKNCVIYYDNFLINNSIIICKKNINNCNNWIDQEYKIINLDSIILNSDLKNKIISNFQNFINSKNKYNLYNIPFKKIYLFYGTSGTGKTSFINALSNYFNYQIYYLDLNYVINESSLINLLNKIDSASTVLVIEDISFNIESDLLSSCIKNTEFSTQSKILNFLNIIRDYNFLSNLVILTSNSYTKLFDNFIDIKYEFTNCSTEQFKQFYLLFYKNYIPISILNKIDTNNYSPKQLIKIYLNNINDEYKFLLEINDLNKNNFENDIHNYFNSSYKLITHNYNIIQLIIVLTHFCNLLKSSNIIKKYQYRLNFINKIFSQKRKILSDDEISID